MLELERHPENIQANSEPAGEQTSPHVSVDADGESLEHELRGGLLDCYVGHGAQLTGAMGFKGMLRVDGHLSGRISSPGGTLILSMGGRIDADIEVAVALINGTVNGDIVATKRIEISRVAHVTGNIQTPALTIAEGAILEGSCRMTKLAEDEGEQGEEGGASNVLLMRAGRAGAF